MKKRIIAAALLTAAAVGSTPAASYAAEVKVIRIPSQDCYNVYSGQGITSLRQTLKELCTASGGNWSYCPDIVLPDCWTPDADAPDISQPGTPDSDTPDINIPETPDTDAPDSNIPETPDSGTPDSDTPDSNIPETPDAGTPDINVPGAGTTSPEKPILPDAPDVNEPETEQLSYAEQVVKLVNEEREKQGLTALTVQTDITAAANVRAKEIKQKFSHTRPDGSSFSSALKEQGVSYRGSGENIAYGQKTPEQVMEAWMNSDGHRANILNKNFKNIGVGYYQDERGVNHWVQLFTY